MAFLSIERDGMMVGCANPIYLTAESNYSSGAKITFEVLESDAGSLKRLVGKVETFGFRPEPTAISSRTYEFGALHQHRRCFEPDARPPDDARGFDCAIKPEEPG